MAEGAQRVLGADVGISVTGVAGPDEMEGQPVGHGLVRHRGARPRDRGGHRPAAVRPRAHPPVLDHLVLNLLRMRLARVAVSRSAVPAAARSSRSCRRRRCSTRIESVARTRPPGRAADGLRWTRARAVAPDPAVPRRGATIADALTESVAESVRRVAPFTLALGGGGAFPSPRRASVVWLGVSTGADELTALAGVITATTAPLGFAGDDDRPYRPHLTLARVNAARDVRAARRAPVEGSRGTGLHRRSCRVVRE